MINFFKFVKKEKMGKNKNNNISHDSFNFIINSTIIEGNVISETNFRIDGTIKGNVMVKGKLIIGETGRVEGDITCHSAEISGTVIGKVQTEDLLSLKSNSNVKGELYVGKLSIEPNAKFNGTSKMKEEPSAFLDND